MKKINFDKIALKIKERRLKLGLSYQILEEKTGISRSTLQRYETGKIKNLPIDKFELISKALGITPIELMGWADEKKYKSNFEVIETKKVPLYGTASAGNGYINLELEIEEFIIPKEDYREGRFSVRVAGDSMTSSYGGRSIPSGSVALVDPLMCGNVEELVGKVCVFTYNDETYIKQLRIDNQNLVHLVSFNEDITDIIVLNKKELKCEGRVVKTYFEQKW